ncbi:2-C-methyl-D-erythritol 4-phosphate cytidylyltransferase [Marinobacterium sp. AK62]|uniref:2-C-methyl-D-erythritol 4-phosphate cytidylyltransferase n=1 Tax=Marinobacterium alkalitolerans TaxID=1542925 RepID=A0ABS3ZDH7_9GAMM|nr:2-C-methyl-D-erythritol 4-phosphate cytidylyltransferase [Marinobacterium alkalitolerans]MBP0049727.1 2-C-methyl-D-erythritol 4-phosphate cytidylyltransferase [Marinobacterium alkalitolerans]
MCELSVVIPAAGIGSRLGQGPKAWLEMDATPLLVWVARKALHLTNDVWAAVLPEDYAHAVALFQRHHLPVNLITGGASRQESVQQLVNASHGKWVMIQDVARPFATVALLRSVFDHARLHGAAAAFLPPEVPVAVLEAGMVTGYHTAAEALVFQAPQAFPRTALNRLLCEARKTGTHRQSTAQLWLDAGRAIYPVHGEKTNIKLTTPEDWVIAQALKEYLYQ